MSNTTNTRKFPVFRLNSPLPIGERGRLRISPQAGVRGLLFGVARLVSRSYKVPSHTPKPTVLHFLKEIRLLVGISLFFLVFSMACGPKAPSLVLDAEDQFTLAKGEFQKKHYDKAVLEFQKLIFNYPGAIFIDSAQYLLGMSYFNQKDYPSAQGEFNKLLSSFPTSRLSDDAAFMVAFCDYKMSPRAELDPERTIKAIEELNSFLDDFPESERAKEAQDLVQEGRSKLAKKAYQSGRLYLKMKQYEAALIYLKDVINEYHDTPWAALAQFYIAEAYFKQKKYEQAKEEYQKFLENFAQDKLAGKVKRRLDILNSKKMQAEK
jgi:outer membrane protein assembly factor BamD